MGAKIIIYTDHAALVDGKKRQVAADTQASREKPRGADPELSSDLRWTLDRMVVTEGVPVNLTL